jgi:DNA-binding SARP family transcriptional activator
MTIHLRLLGAPQITTPAGPVPAGKPFVFAAALFLGLNRGRVVRREEVATLLWPDADDAKRSERMRWLVRQLKLAGLRLEGGSPEISLAAADVADDVDALRTAPSATDALALVGAGVLAGYDPQISDRFSRWLEDTRDACRADVLRVLGEWLVTTRRRRSWPVVEAIARRMLALDETRDDAARALEESTTMQGRRGGNVSSHEESKRLVGREDALARLLEGLRPSTAAGHRLGIAGPAGIGKSRLLEELEHRAEQRGLPVATVRCQRGDALRPLSLAVDLARALMQLPGALGASPESLAAVRRFTGADPSVDDGESPEARRAAVYRALRDLIGAITDEAGLVVLVEDAQWAEPSSWALLAPAMAERPASPLCWAVTLRAETREQAAEQFEMMFPREDAASEQERELLWLTPLAPAEVEQICAARAGARVVPAAVRETLTARAAGVPFIAEALVDHWLEVGDLSSLPPSVTRLVVSRLERQSAPARQLLGAIAVLGLDATPPAAEVVAQLGRRELLAAVAELETSGILRTVDRVLSAHALWTEAMLAGMPATAVQLIHRTAAEWLEERVVSQAEVAPRHHWAVASHWIAAGDHEEARRALDTAASMLADNGFIEEAAAMLERAGDLAGVSNVALEHWRRSAMLWAELYERRATHAIGRIHVKFDRVGHMVNPKTFNPHNDVEMQFKDVMLRTEPTMTRNETCRPFFSCALSEDASPLHRLRATKIIFGSYGLIDLDRHSAEVMWKAVARISPANDQETLEYECCAALYYAHVAIQPNRAAAHAHRAVTIVLTSPVFNVADDSSSFPMTARSRVVLPTIADVYECLGDVEQSLALRRMLLEQGRQRRRRSSVLVALEGLIGTLLELGRHEEARPLLAEFGRPPAAGSPHDAFGRARLIHWVTCALEEGNAAQARADLTLPVETADQATGMERARVLSMHIHLAMLEGEEATIATLWPRLLACFVDRYHFMDHPALIAARCLERFEGWNAATVFVKRFVSEHRMERWTPRAELRRYLTTRRPTVSSP